MTPSVAIGRLLLGRRWTSHRTSPDTGSSEARVSSISALPGSPTASAARSGSRRIRLRGERRCRPRRSARPGPAVMTTPPISTGSSTVPAPVLLLLRGLVPRALMPISRSSIATLSRMQPCTTMPAQPRSTAMAAIRSPTSAERSDPPPSTTSTRPCGSGCSDSVFFSRALSSKHFTVTAGPANRAWRPKLRSWTGMLASASPCSSTRSAVACGSTRSDHDQLSS